MDFKYQCHLLFMDLLVEYTKTKSKKRKKELVEKMEALRHGLMPITTNRKENNYGKR